MYSVHNAALIPDYEKILDLRFILLLLLLPLLLPLLPLLLLPKLLELPPVGCS